jgi:hypothetical protein
MTILPIATAYTVKPTICPAMTTISTHHHLFCNMYVVVTPTIERQLDAHTEDTETEERDRQHKIKKVCRKSKSCLSFMKQHF